MVILYKCHYEDILFMRSFTNNIFFAQEVSVYMVFLSHPFLKMTNIDKHQGRKMLLTKIVVSWKSQDGDLWFFIKPDYKSFYQALSDSKLGRDLRFITWT